LTIDFPLIAADSLGCGAVYTADSSRRFTWIAAFNYDTQSSLTRVNSQNFVLIFGLPVIAQLSAARLDSATRSGWFRFEHASGDPPMTSGSRELKTGEARLSTATLDGRQAWRMRFNISDSIAVRTALRARSDSVTLVWWQRDESPAFQTVPLVRR
jgi:hypothetical protein